MTGQEVRKALLSCSVSDAPYLGAIWDISAVTESNGRQP